MKLRLPIVILWLAISLVAANYDLPVAFLSSGAIRTTRIRLETLKGSGNYSLLYSVPVSAFGPGSQLRIELREGDTTLISKILHAGDADLYAPFHVGGPAELRITDTGPTGSYSLKIDRWPDSLQLKRGSNHIWQAASPMTLGQTVFASSDEAEYIPIHETRKQYATDTRDEDWYRFHFDGAPKLVFFQLELMDRDDLPVDVSVFRVNNGKPEEYTRGQDPVAVFHEVQALPGNKFAPRIFTQPGDYYVRVRANHPEYKLRTRLYNPPPYVDPREAVRTAVDYIMAAGDSWFANTPRRGGTLDRITPVHQETSLCVGCHPSHFSQRAQLYSQANGYPLVQRQQLQFLEDRFYNNPRPLYGFEKEGAVWARVISAPANVLSRISLLTTMFENNVSRMPRPAYHDAINKYLDLYYAGRKELPPDETNGNTPLVSAFEVGWYSWKVGHDPKLPGLMAAAPVKNLNDLAYQTLALADIDKAKYADQVARNAARLLSLQRADGQWSMKFEANEPEVEFATGHALWALSSAGIPADHPQVKKAVDYLMKRQQPFGGWMDPLQSFENFRTPFRETQFAVVSLSSYFPMPNAAKGWDSPTISALSNDPVKLLDQLDQIWDMPSEPLVKQIEAAAHSNDPLIRQAATEALGRLALPATVPELTQLLNDPSKLVQRASAWSLRQVYANHPETEDREIAAALQSADSRERWGATRVFAHHFAALAKRNDLMAPLAKLAASEPAPAIRMQAIRGLWQSWFWNADLDSRNRIEDTLLAALQKRSYDPWIEANLRAAVSNIADENVRYLYNNWVTLLPNQADRDRVIQGRLAVEARLATKFSAILNNGSDAVKKELLAALTDVKQRRADIYDLESDLSSEGTPVYNRIGNDIEQIAFFGGSADLMSRAIAPLIDSKDPEMRRLARTAALMVRETPYAQVEKAAGGRGKDTLDLGHHIDAAGDAVEISKAFHAPAPRSASSATPAVTASAAPRTKLDEAYFRANVEPILKRKGEDGYACVNCHATHTLFNATWETVMNVVDTREPENSLLLRKPTSTAESEGVVGAKTTVHGGGRRWAKGSPEYETILDWIKGASIGVPAASAH